jgi:hypothetical protein
MIVSAVGSVLERMMMMVVVVVVLVYLQDCDVLEVRVC